MSHEPFRALARRLWLLLAQVWLFAGAAAATAGLEAAQLHDWLAMAFLALGCAASIAGVVSALRAWRILR